MGSTLRLLLQLLLLSLVSASHYFGGTTTFTYKGKNPDGSFKVDIRDRDTYDGCYDSLYWYCSNSNCGYSSRVQRKILDSSTSAPMYNRQWCETETVTTRVVWDNKPFQMWASSCCWVPTVYYGWSHSWTLSTLVDLGERSDTKQPNRSPEIAILPFLRVPQNCPRTYRLMSFDPDGDKVRCRYGNPGSQECAGCIRNPGFHLDQDSCTLHYQNTNANPSVRSFEIVVEDFPRGHISLNYTDGSRSYRSPLSARRRKRQVTNPWYTQTTTTPSPTTVEEITTAGWGYPETTTTPSSTTAEEITTAGWGYPQTTTTTRTTTTQGTTTTPRTTTTQGTTTTRSPTTTEEITTAGWGYPETTTTPSSTTAEEITTAGWGYPQTTTTTRTTTTQGTTTTPRTTTTQGTTTTPSPTTTEEITTAGWMYPQTTTTPRTTTTQETTTTPRTTTTQGTTTTPRTTTTQGTTTTRSPTTTEEITTAGWGYPQTTTTPRTTTTQGTTTTPSPTTTEEITTAGWGYPQTTTIPRTTTTQGTTTTPRTTTLQGTTTTPRTTTTQVTTTIPWWWTTRIPLQATSPPLSKLPLQFSFLVDPPVPSCQEGLYLPMFVNPTPANGEQIHAEVNKEVEIRIKAQASYATIQDIIISGPMNMTKHRTTHDEFVLRWTPLSSDLGDYFPVCFAVESATGSAATSSLGYTHSHSHFATPTSQSGVYQSEMRCVVLQVGKKEIKTNVICTESTMRVEVEKSSFRGLHENHLRLSESSNTLCSLERYSNSTHVIGVIPLNACGTQLEEDAENLIFKNEITTVDDSRDVITRRHHLEVEFYCQYPRKGNVSLGFTAHRKSVEVWDKGFGKFTYQFEFYPNNQFQNMIDPKSYPLEYDVGQKIYMEIDASTTVNDTEIFVESCRASPYDNPNYHPTYSIIEDGCPVDPTVMVHATDNKRQFRFCIEAFKFISLHDQVYISCSVIMCEAGNPNTRCSQGCINSTSNDHHHRRKRDAAFQTAQHFISQGPLRLKRSADISSTAGNNLNLNLNLVFIAGCLLVAVGMICGVAMYRSKMSKVKYQPLPSCES